MGTDPPIGMSFPWRRESSLFIDLLNTLAPLLARLGGFNGMTTFHEAIYLQCSLFNAQCPILCFYALYPPKLAKAMLPGLMVVGSVSTLMHVVLPDAKASSKAGPMSSGRSTIIPLPPSASTSL